MNLEIYKAFAPETPPIDPRENERLNEIAETIMAIVEQEGPIPMSLLVRRYVHATPDLSRAGGAIRATLTKATARLEMRERVVYTHELGIEDDDHLVIFTGEQQIRARTRDDRTLHEIPLSELAIGFLQVRREMGISRYSERALRKLLSLLGLKRLTDATRQRLNFAWHIADRWYDERSVDGKFASVETRPLPDGVVVAPEKKADAASPMQDLPEGVMPWQAAMQSGPKTVRRDDE